MAVLLNQHLSELFPTKIEQSNPHDGRTHCRADKLDCISFSYRHQINQQLSIVLGWWKYFFCLTFFVYKSQGKRMKKFSYKWLKQSVSHSCRTARVQKVPSFQDLKHRRQILCCLFITFLPCRCHIWFNITPSLLIVLPVSMVRTKVSYSCCSESLCCIT